MRSELCSRLEGIIEKITYKPGWQIMVEDYDHQTIWGTAVRFKVQMWVNNLHAPGEMEAFFYVRTIRPYEIQNMTDGDILQQVIRQTLLICESHEMDEWLKHEGKHVTDPHPELEQQRA